MRPRGYSSDTQADFALAPPPEKEPPRVEILREAERLITGDRNKSYGSPTQNFADIAGMLNIRFANKLKPGEEFDPDEVAEIMILVKICRMKKLRKKDNWADIIGYGACGTEAAIETGKI